MLDFLLNKYLYNVINKMSDFGCPVNVVIDNFEDKLVEENEEEKINLYSCEASIYNEDHSELLAVLHFGEKYNATEINIKKDMVKNLITVAFSGIYRTARQEDSVMRSFMDYEVFWKCTVCDEEFTSIDEFYSHLIENKHKSTIFAEYPFDKELRRIRKVIETEIKTDKA